MDDAEGSDTLHGSGAWRPYSQWLVLFVGVVCLSGGVGGTLQPKFARVAYKNIRYRSDDRSYSLCFR